MESSDPNRKDHAMRQKQIPRSVILSALERLRHAQSCIRHGDIKSINPRLQGHSSDFIYGALWALQMGR